MRALEGAHACHTAEDPRELVDFGKIRLPNQVDSLGQLEAQSQIRCGDLVGTGTEKSGIPERGQGVVVRDEEQTLGSTSGQLEVLSHSAEVVPQMQRARGLDARNDARHGVTDPWVAC